MRLATYSLVVNASKIVGVLVPEVDDHITHIQFADDTSILIQAKREYMDNLFQNFKTLGKASGLFVKESGVKVVLVPELSVPVDLRDLD